MDVAVIGGGVMGLATAWRLALAGADVEVFERFEIGHGNGSSHGPTRVFRFLYDDPLYVRMAQASLPLWRELEADSGAALLHITGGLHVDRYDVLDRHREALVQCGAAVEQLSAEDRQERFEWLTLGPEPALWVPDMGVISAEAATGALRRVAIRNGVKVHEGTHVKDIRRISARVYVVAAGAWMNELVPMNLPLRVTCEQVLYFKTEEEMVPFVHGLPHWIYAVPKDGIVKVAEHGTGREVNPNDRSFDLDEHAAARVFTYTRNALASVSDPFDFDTCLYTTTPDGDFVIDRQDDVVVVSACSGHGFKFAPLVGEIAASLALGRATPLDITRFRMDRFF